MTIAAQILFPKRPSPREGVRESGYRSIGAALRNYEESKPLSTLPFRGRRDGEAEFDLRIAISFVSVEVLQSYVEDLLDTSLSDEALCIERTTPFASRNVHLVTAGLFALLAGVIAVVALRYPMIVALSGVVLLVLGLSIVLPREHLLRRIRFARVLSNEISRRHGDGRSTPIRLTEARTPPALSSFGRSFGNTALS